MIFEIALIFCAFVFSKKYKPIYPCLESTEVLYLVNGTPITGKYEEYCYKNLGSGVGSLYNITSSCERWFPGAKPFSINSLDEMDFILSEISTGNPLMSGLIKTVPNTVSTTRTYPANADKYKWLDGTSNVWILDIYLDDYYPGKWDNTGISGLNCFRYTPSTSVFWNTDCVENTNDAVCKFRVPMCFGIRAYNESVCNGKGTCYADDKCFCGNYLYFGENCETTHTCGPLRQDDMNVCSSKGNCTSQDNCICEEGYYGFLCENKLPPQVCSGDGMFQNGRFCYKKFPGESNNTFEAEDVCSSSWSWGYGGQIGHLVSFESFSDERFVRDTFGLDFFIGLRKNITSTASDVCVSTPIEYGTYWMNNVIENTYSFAKGKRLRCDGGMTSLCFGIKEQYYWDDINCSSERSLDIVCQKEIYMCSGILSTDPKQCSGRGLCTGNSICSCYNGYTGVNCEEFSCFGVSPKYHMVDKYNKPCHGHGNCTAPNRCECFDDLYGGVDCGTTICNGVLSTDNDTCYGHGKCIGYDTCECDWMFGGDFCRSSYPPTGKYTPAIPSSDLQNRVIKWTQKTELKFGSYDEESLYRIANDTIRKDFLDHEKVAFEEWYPGKGHTMYIHSDEQYNWMKNQRTLLNMGSPLDDLWVGLLKTTVDGGGDFTPCNGGNPDWIGFDWIDRTINSWANGGTPPTGSSAFDSLFLCNSECVCFRINQGPDLNDGACFMEMFSVYHYPLHRCNSIREDDISVCGGNGFCWEFDNCTCKRNKGLTGDYCESKTCHGIKSYEYKTVCSGHGDCIDDNRCSCDENWYGDSCNVTICFGILSNNSHESGLSLKPCSTHGECIAPDICKCNPFYFGKDCAGSYCGNKKSTSADVCGGIGFGNCPVNNYCQCNSTAKGNRAGKLCTSYQCDHTWSWNTGACNARGICIGLDVCECIPNRYYGLLCEHTTCFGLLSNSSSVCNYRNGDCLEYDECSCHEGYYSSNCSITECYGIFSNDSDVCNHKGTCFRKDQCICNFPPIGQFVGDYCNTTSCSGVFSNDTGIVCGGNGRCIDFEKCDCNEDYYGENCNVTSCYGIFSNETSVCSTKGSCNQLDDCKCVEDYYGTYCNITTCDGLFSNESNVCSGEGRCFPIGECQCYDIGQGGDCDGSTCKSDYFGSHCNVTLCYGVFSNETEKICNGSGKCLEAGICTCDYVGFGGDCDGEQCLEGKYFGDNCTVTKCGNLYSNMTGDVCGGHGYCWPFGVCNCYGEWDGDDCNVVVSPTIIHSIAPRRFVWTFSFLYFFFICLYS